MMHRVPARQLAVLFAVCCVAAPTAVAVCSVQVVGSIAPTDGGAANFPALITPSSAGTPASISNAGISERVSDVLVYDNGVSPNCFSGSQFVNLTYNLLLNSPPLGTFSATATNFDVYDSAGISGLAIKATATPSSAPDGSPQTTISVQMLQAGTAGNPTFNGTGSAFRLKNLRFDARPLAVGALATVTVSTTVAGTFTPAAFTVGVAALPLPVPTLTTISPAVAVAGSQAFTLTVSGSNFVSTSVVQWNGASRNTTFVSGTQLSAAITAADIASAGTSAVTVLTPAPGGGSTTSISFFATTAAGTFPFGAGNNRYWPHIVTGNGYVTKMTITNLSPSQNPVLVYLYSQAGAVLQTNSYSLPPAGTVRFATDESARFAAATTRWAVINSQATVGINLFFEVILDPNTGIVANTLGFNDSPALTAFSLPVEFQPAQSGFRTVGIACANPNNTAATITMKLIDQGGNVVSTGNLNPVSPPSTGPLTAFGQTGADLQGTFSSVLPQANFLGSLTVTSNVPVSCIGLEDDLGLFSATPPIPRGTQ